eukprot:11196643-Lingulodinium_polyedra.AAC.1
MCGRRGGWLRGSNTLRGLKRSFRWWSFVHDHGLGFSFLLGAGRRRNDRRFRLRLACCWPKLRCGRNR